MSAGRQPARVTACVWCGTALDQRAERLAGRIRCASCGAATTDPPPTDRELAAAYAAYRPEGGRFGFAGDAVLRRTRGLLAARLNRIAPPGAILDVGAGEGVLVDALRARGREATGLEREPQRGDLRDEPLAAIDGEWAAVVFWHSLEHLHDPRDCVREARRLLAPGGIIAVAMPNNDSLQARAFGDRWLHLDPPRHLVHLSTRSLLAGLEADGFEVERVAALRGGQIVIGWLDGLVGLLPTRPSLYQALRRPEARLQPQSAPRRALAVVGAVALLPLALAGTMLELISRRPGTIYVEARLG